MLVASFERREVASVEETVGIVAGVIGLLGYFPYIKDIVRGDTKPEPASWFIWLLEYVALFFAQLQKGASGSLWIIGLQTFGVIAIFALSVMRTMSKRRPRMFFAEICKIIEEKKMLFLLICAALVAWHFADASVAVIILLAVEASGVALTIGKVYNKPGSETLSTWSCIGAAGFLGIFSVNPESPAILYAYPISLVVMNFGVVIASLLGAHNAKKQSPIAALCK